MNEKLTWHMTDKAIKEAQRISERLRNATSAKEVNQIADEEREIVLEFLNDQRNHPLGRNISNLKSYMLQIELPHKEKASEQLSHGR